MDISAVTQALAADGVPGDVFLGWLDRMEPKVSAFLVEKDALPYGKNIPDERALVWFYRMNSVLEKRPYMDSIDREWHIRERLGKISPRELATVMRKFRGDTAFEVKNAETIRRAMLMMTAPEAYSPTPNSRLLQLARSAMTNEAEKLAGRFFPGKHPLTYRQPNNPFIVAAGNRYRFIFLSNNEEEVTLNERYFPFLFLTNFSGETSDIIDELGVLASICSENCPGVGWVSIDSSTFVVSTGFCDKEVIRPHAEEAKDAAERFFHDHLAGNIPMPWTPRKEVDGMLSGRSLSRFEDLSREAAVMTFLEKAAKERGAEIRAKMENAVRTGALDLGTVPENVGVPSQLFTMRTKQVVDEEGLENLLSVPGARENVMTWKPDAKKMEKVLKKAKAPREEWCVEAVDPARVLAFCDEEGMDAPVTASISFALNPKGDPAMREEAEAAALDMLGVAPENAPAETM